LNAVRGKEALLIRYLDASPDKYSQIYLNICC
jgi:hypothetical protein